MWILTVLFLAVGYAAALFGVGRFLQPSHDRLRMRRLDNPAVVQTLARGWAVLTSAHSLRRITDELSADRRSPRG